MPKGMSRAGSVNRSTLRKLHDKYRAIWNRGWPHDDDYLRKLWNEAQDKNEKGNSRIPQAEVYETCLLAMRENHEFEATP